MPPASDVLAEIGAPCRGPALPAALLSALLLCACGSGSPVAPDASAPAGNESAQQGEPGEPLAARPDTSDSGDDSTTEPDTGADPNTDTGTDTSTDTGSDAAAATDGPIACQPFSASDRIAILSLVNEARAQARSCGSERFAAVGPLGWDSRLEDAARTQSADMAANNFFSHTGSDGSNVGERMTRAGYDWRGYAENIAAGQDDHEDAIQGWLNSPGHCRNLMSTTSQDIGMACVSNADSQYRHYWTQVFGVQR